MLSDVLYILIGYLQALQSRNAHLDLLGVGVQASQLRDIRLGLEQHSAFVEICAHVRSGISPSFLTFEHQLPQLGPTTLKGAANDLLGRRAFLGSHGETPR